MCAVRFTSSFDLLRISFASLRLCGMISETVLKSPAKAQRRKENSEKSRAALHFFQGFGNEGSDLVSFFAAVGVGLVEVEIGK